jgi:predicted TIM-barrel fold metal-dependent hydrolase
MTATLHAKPGAPPGVDNMILVSSDTHIGPKLSQLREYCPKQYLAQFDEFAAEKKAEIDATMVQAEIALKLAKGEEVDFEELIKAAQASAGMSAQGPGGPNALMRAMGGDDATREQEIAARMGNAMPTADMAGAMQMIANRLTPGHHDMHTRLRDMDGDGLACEMIFHGSQNGEPIPFITPHDLPAGLTTPFSFEGLDLDLAYAGMHMYNEWLADQCSIEPERHVGLAYIPAWDPEACVKEVEWARERGLRGINMPAWRPGMPVLQDERWEPFYAASASLKMPLTNHGGAGDERVWPAGEGVMLRFLESAYHSRRLIWTLLFHGTFEKYPDLVLMISEIPGEWWPYLMKELDSITGMHGGPGNASEICAQHVYHGATFMSRDEAQDAWLNGYTRNIVWGSDYPHVEGTWQLPMSDDEEPQTHLAIREAFAGIPEAETRDMLGLNGVRAYDLDHEALQKVANRICAPTYEEIKDELPESDVPSAHGLFAFRRVGPWS